MSGAVDPTVVHIGCYTPSGGGQGAGIVLARRDERGGGLAPVGVAAPCESPSFLARHPRLPVLYAVHELAEGAVSGWAVAPDGALRPLGTRATGGAHACHVAVSADGSRLACANYGGGSVSVHPVAADGTPGPPTDVVAHGGRGPHPERQDRAHAHMVSWDPDEYLRAVDLGVDAVLRYAVVDGRLRPADPVLRTPPGSGPRHLARGPAEAGGWLYVVGELDATVNAYAPDPATGELRERATIPASAATGTVHPSEIAVDRGGRYLYVANRGPDTIAVFALGDGKPEYVGEVASGGAWPRHFALWEGMLYVANERSHSVVAFAVSPSSGVPTPTGAALQVPSPTCVRPPAVSTL